MTPLGPALLGDLVSCRSFRTSSSGLFRMGRHSRGSSEGDFGSSRRWCGGSGGSSNVLAFRSKGGGMFFTFLPPLPLPPVVAAAADAAAGGDADEAGAEGELDFMERS